MQAVQPVVRPVSSWLLRHPFLRRFASGKTGHAEVNAHSNHPWAHDHVRHFETPVDCVPFPVYPYPKLYVGLVYWGFLTAPVATGVYALLRAKSSK